MKILGTMVVAAAMMVASVNGASAATVTYQVVTNWNDYSLANTGSLGGGAWQTLPTADPGALVSGSNSIHRSPFDGSGTPELAATDWEQLPYWAIGPQNPSGNTDHQATLEFGFLATGFSFIWGSVDNYNSLTFYNGATSFVLNLASLLAGTNLGGPAVEQNKGAVYVALSNFAELGGGFNKIVFRSSPSEALEVANFAAVPLPAGVLLLGSGLAGLGFLGWRRKRSDTGAAAAA